MAKKLTWKEVINWDSPGKLWVSVHEVGMASLMAGYRFFSWHDDNIYTIDPKTSIISKTEYTVKDLE